MLVAHDVALDLVRALRSVVAQLRRYSPEAADQVERAASSIVLSLLDPVAFPADEIVLLYHERWELELGDDEIKTELLDREAAIHSRSPHGCSTGALGRLLGLQPRTARKWNASPRMPAPPTRISFVAALRLTCDEWLWCAVAAPGAIPRHLRDLRASLAALILLPRRSERRYPRAVKIKMSNYARKRRSSPSWSKGSK